MHERYERLAVSSSPLLGAVNIGMGEVLLIVFLLLVLGVMALGVMALVYFIVGATQNRPASPPTSGVPPALAAEAQQKRDREHLKLLAIFHFVFGGLALAGIGFLAVHYAFMHTIFSNPQLWKGPNAGMPPKAFLDMFIWFYVLMGVLMIIISALNVLSGLFLLKKRNRLFSLVIAGLNCLQLPFGAALGVCTFLVLLRDNVREMYAREAGTERLGRG